MALFCGEFFVSEGAFGCGFGVVQFSAPHPSLGFAERHLLLQRRRKATPSPGPIAVHLRRCFLDLRLSKKVVVKSVTHAGVDFLLDA